MAVSSTGLLLSTSGVQWIGAGSGCAVLQVHMRNVCFRVVWHACKTAWCSQKVHPIVSPAAALARVGAWAGACAADAAVAWEPVGGGGGSGRAAGQCRTRHVPVRS